MLEKIAVILMHSMKPDFKPIKRVGLKYWELEIYKELMQPPKYWH